MPRKKPEETPEARIDRLRSSLPADQYVRRLQSDMTAIVNELFFIGERLDADLQDIVMPTTLMPTEYLTIVGFQFIDDDGNRGGDVRMLYRDGSMPYWVAEGLLSRATGTVSSSNEPAYFHNDGDGDANAG